MQNVKTYEGSYIGEAGGGYVDPVGAAALPDTGVTAGAYGLAGSVATFTVDAKGRVSSVVNTPISITEAQVVGLTADLGLKAPLASPALIGTPTAPTAAPGTNTSQISSTAFVAAAIAALVASSPATLDTLNELATALGNDPNFATTMATALGLKAVDTAVVHKAGAESIPGIKTFTSGLSFGGTNLSNYTEGSFTPTFIGLTETGGISTKTGGYIRIGNWVQWWVKIVPVTSTSSAGGYTTYINNIPFSNLRPVPALSVINDATVAIIGFGLVGGGGLAFMPAWSAVANSILISGTTILI